MDFSRLRTGDLIAAIGGIALIGFLFMDWFSVESIGAAGSPSPIPSGVPEGFEIPGAETTSTGISGWDGLGFDGFILLLTGLAGIKLAGLRAAGKKLIGPLPFAGWLVLLGSVAETLIIWRIFASPNDADLEIGIFLGLIAAAAVTLGAWLSSRDDGAPLYANAVAGAGARSSSARSTGTRKASTRSTTTRKKS
jgi:hypothetical protein